MKKIIDIIFVSSLVIYLVGMALSLLLVCIGMCLNYSPYEQHTTFEKIRNIVMIVSYSMFSIFIISGVISAFL